jgi:hypothetical protein
MSTIAEIKSKYSLDGAVSVTVDLESLRESANEIMRDAESFANDSAKSSLIGEGDWMRLRKAHIGQSVKKIRRQVAMVQKSLSEATGFLDKADETLAKVK